MSKKRKACPADGTAEQAEREVHWESDNSRNECTMRKRKISSLLLEGRENAIPRRELERLTDLDGRTVRLMIEQERRAGIPVLADNSTGYFLPANDNERAECVRSMRHRAGEILKTAQAIEGNVDFIEGQVELDDI